MELLDRYLQAVKNYLPKKRRDDIVAELSANIQAQMEEKADELGRPLDDDEQAAILKKLGHPLLVAVRFFPHQHVIGPTVFPYYWFVLKASLSIAALVYTIVSAVTMALGTVTLEGILAAVLRFPGIALNVALWVTIAFFVLDLVWGRYGVKCRFFDSWDPRSLPAVEPESRRRKPCSIADLTASLIFALYLIALPKFPFLIVGPGALYFQNSPLGPAPALRLFYWAIVALLLTSVTLKAVYLVRASWRRYRAVTDFVLTGAGLVILFLLMRVPEYVVVAGVAEDLARYQKLAGTLNHALLLAVRVTTVVLLLQILWEAGRFIVDRVHAHTGAWQGMKQ